MSSVLESREKMLAFRSPLFGGDEFRLTGEWDPKARAVWEGATSQIASTFPDITEANVSKLREMAAKDPAERTSDQVHALARCETTVLSFDGREFGSPDNPNLEIRVHVPMRTDEDASVGKRRGLLFYHGGAFILGSAAEEDPWACRLAADCDIVVFNVEYRNAPEARAPKGILDCYAALKYVVEELSDRFRVDDQRIGAYGISSGGYLAVGVAMELAKRDEAALTKLIIADVPAISDHWVEAAPSSGSEGEGAWHWRMHEVENWHGSHGHIETLRMLAVDWERQVRERDPYLFPGTMGDSLLRKVPKHVVMTREFDFLRADSELYACDLLRCGKLLDFYVRPGASHYTGPQNGVLEKIIDAYL